jgi:hypothetical protein
MIEPYKIKIQVKVQYLREKTFKSTKSCSSIEDVEMNRKLVKIILISNIIILPGILGWIPKIQPTTPNISNELLSLSDNEWNEEIPFDLKNETILNPVNNPTEKVDESSSDMSPRSNSESNSNQGYSQTDSADEEEVSTDYPIAIPDAFNQDQNPKKPIKIPEFPPDQFS